MVLAIDVERVVDSIVDLEDVEVSDVVPITTNVKTIK